MRYLKSSLVGGRFQNYLRSDWSHGIYWLNMGLHGGWVQFEILEIAFVISSIPVTNYLVRRGCLCVFDCSGIVSIDNCITLILYMVV